MSMLLTEKSLRILIWRLPTPPFIMLFVVYYWNQTDIYAHVNVTLKTDKFEHSPSAYTAIKGLSPYSRRWTGGISNFWHIFPSSKSSHWEKWHLTVLNQKRLWHGWGNHSSSSAAGSGSVACGWLIHTETLDGGSSGRRSKAILFFFISPCYRFLHTLLLVIYSRFIFFFIFIPCAICFYIYKPHKCLSKEHWLRYSILSGFR